MVVVDMAVVQKMVEAHCRLQQLFWAVHTKRTAVFVFGPVSWSAMFRPRGAHPQTGSSAREEPKRCFITSLLHAFYFHSVDYLLRRPDHSRRQERAANLSIIYPADNGNKAAYEEQEEEKDSPATCAQEEAEEGGA